MKKKIIEEATLESLRKIEESTRKTVERLDRLEKTSRLASALTSLTMLLAILTILLAMFMPVFTLSIILRESFLRDILSIVALGMGIGLIFMLWVLNKALNKIIKAKREST